MKKTLLLACAAIIILALPGLGAPIAFTSLGSWNTAMAGNTILTETFTTSLLPTTVVTPLPGSNTHSSGYPVITGITGSCPLCSGTVWLDFLNDGPVYTTTFSYSGGPIMGFGAVWDTGPNLEGSGITVTATYVGGATAGLGTLSSIDDWHGWTFTSPVDHFTLSTSGIGEHFQMDNLVFAAPPAAVPEPGTLLLLGSALLGLGLWRRKRT